MSTAPRSPVAVGIVGRLVGDPTAWSGIPTQLSEGLRQLGFQTFTISAEPPPWVLDRARGYLRLTGRLDNSWAQTAELMLIRDALVRVRRRRHEPAGPVRWVQMGSEFGAPLGRGFVTFEDMTVASAVGLPDYLGGPVRTRVARGWMRRQKRIYDKASVCCVASRWQAASLVQDYGVPVSKVRVVGFGQSLIDEPRDREWSTPRFLFIGLGWERKNGPQLLEAFRRVRRVRPQATLDLVGDHPPVDEPGVIGHGRLDHSRAEDRKRAVDLLQRATCFVMPSRYEPFGIAYVEAGAAGVGSIGTTVGGALDAIGPGGILVDPRHQQGLIEAMLAFCEPQTARNIGARACEHAALLTWARVSARVATALDLPLPSGPEQPLVELDEAAEWDRHVETP